ncbi:acyltransferase [Tenacibaculum aquimarinum]|uniref:acyltransferase n=1 Tax=Tenacibaculum aquimarinum TaxID=2910675 RepID=UPI001F0A5620|nr:acyltransferase [Tenacibaculum aquimarinum]MCH3884614.1 acyltransferase [Tenacibaculum aquimarinum]
MKKFLKKGINIFNNYRFSKKAIFRGSVNLSNINSSIKLILGSKKEDIVLSDRCVVFGSLISCNRGKIFFEKNVQIGFKTIVGAVDSVTIGEGTVISNNVVIMDNNNHSVNPEDRKIMQNSPVGSKFRNWTYSVSKPIVIEKNVWIGQFARINKGVVIGENSIIAAGSIVTKDVPKNSVAAGNPAKIVKENIQDEPRLIL